MDKAQPMAIAALKIRQTSALRWVGAMIGMVCPLVSRQIEPAQSMNCRVHRPFAQRCFDSLSVTASRSTSISAWVQEKLQHSRKAAGPEFVRGRTRLVNLCSAQTHERPNEISSGLSWLNSRSQIGSEPALDLSRSPRNAPSGKLPVSVTQTRFSLRKTSCLSGLQVEEMSLRLTRKCNCQPRRIQSGPVLVQLC